MDSLTQIALGAAMGELAMGRKIASKAALYGAMVATLPDMDVLVSMGDPVADFTYHRSWSHSLLVLAAVAPFLALAIHRWRKDPPEWRRAWLLLVGLALLTHPLLDAFTIYGTQLLWPITEYPFGFGSIFIVDPLYTVPLAAGVIAALMTSRTAPKRTRRVVAGLVISSAYLAWSLIAQAIETRVAKEALSAQGLTIDRLLVTPAPFNTLLWRTIAMELGARRYHVGYHSMLDGTKDVRFKPYATGHGLTDRLADHWSVQRLKWFTKGFYRTELTDGDVVVADLRMGVEGRYVFSFKVGRKSADIIEPSPSERVPPIRDLAGLSRIWNRILDATVEIIPTREDPNVKRSLPDGIGE